MAEAKKQWEARLQGQATETEEGINEEQQQPAPAEPNITVGRWKRAGADPEQLQILVEQLARLESTIPSSPATIVSELPTHDQRTCHTLLGCQHCIVLCRRPHAQYRLPPSSTAQAR